jgi:RimJ/RimL family protein N-acetyltransferase
VDEYAEHPAGIRRPVPAVRHDRSMSDSALGYSIVPIDESRLEKCWQLRLRALRDHPDAFGQPYAEAAAKSAEAIRTSYDTFWNFRDNRVFGAIVTTGEIAGMTGIAGWYRDKMRHRVDIWGVYVAPEHRGTGLSRRLLDAAIGYSRTIEGVLQVHLQVVSTNTSAVRAYERAGFRRWGRMPRADIIDGIAYDNDFMVLILDDDSESAEQQTEGS